MELKKLIAIFLLLQFLTNNLFAEEAIKLPKLFQHYQHHSQKHKDINGFADYILKHYVNEHEKNMHDGEDDHSDLPFKHSNGCCLNMHAPVLAFIPSFIETNSAFVTDVIRTYTFENEKIKNISSSPIWQPPKLA